MPDRGTPGAVRHRRVLLRGGNIHTTADPFATAMLVVDGRIAWIGSDAGADTHREVADRLIDLDGALVTPAFVDAHVHVTLTGLGLTGVDLTRANCAGDILEAVASHDPAAPIVLGHGWDDSGWADRELPTRTQLARACAGRPLYLSRVDVHSALVTDALLDAVRPDPRGLAGGSGDGPVDREAHHAVRATALSLVTDGMRAQARDAALHQAAGRGIASVHELSGPGIGGLDDLRALIELGRDPGYPEVIGYWGEMGGVRAAVDVGARGAAGDLFIDGSLGSHTACLSEPYADRPGQYGTSYADATAVAQHIVECTEAGIQAGFHVIGDGAAQIVAEGLRRAADRIGYDRLLAARHRLEHIEMLDAGHLDVLERAGIVASVQPAFDAAWGGPHGMYAERLGPERARRMNAFADMASRGLTLAFGSDAPVTPLDPWGAVRAAVHHTVPEQRISARAAFAAHTRGGRRAAYQEEVQPGVLREGLPATLAIWDTRASDALVVQAPDDRIAAWSTDPRSGTPGLPDLEPGRPAPGCLATIRDGFAIHDREVWGRELWVVPDPQDHG